MNSSREYSFHSETTRLILREFQEKDAPFFYRLNNDPLVMQFTGDVPFQSVEEAKAFVKNYTAYKKNGFGRWTVLLKSSQTPIGWCGLKEHPDGMVDLGYRFLQSEWGNGYATEAAQHCLDYGIYQLGIKEIIGRTASENQASIRVLEKIGMTFWKKAPCEGIANSVYYRFSNEKTSSRQPIDAREQASR